MFCEQKQQAQMNTASNKNVEVRNGSEQALCKTTE